MKCCRFLLHQILFSWGAIHPCCSYTVHSTKSQTVFEYFGELFDISSYIQNRQKYIDAFKNDNPPPCYKDCIIYETDKHSSEKVCFTILNVSNRTKCSCNCIYCDLREKGNQEKRNELNSREPYDIKPVLKDLQNRNLIADNCSYFIDGGECSEYPDIELQWLLLYALNNNCNITLLSSGIKFSPYITKVLSVANVNMKISVDAGTKSVYEKIKRVKAYNAVWNNLAKYIETSKDNPNAVIEIKYVIIPGVNDTVEEAEAFINKCRSINAKNIIIDIEHYWLYNESSNADTTSIKEVTKYFEKQKKEFHVDYIQVGKPFLMELLK